MTRTEAEKRKQYDRCFVPMTLEQWPDGLWRVIRTNGVVALFRTKAEALAAYGKDIVLEERSA